MSKKLHKTLAVATLALGFAVTGIAAVGVQSSSKAQAAEWSEVSINETYDYGSEFVMPTRKVTIGTDTVTATGVLEFPNGTVTRGTSAILNASGKYTLRYTAILKGQPYVEEINFTVVNPVVKFETQSSSARYGIYDSIAAGATKEVTTSGLLVSLANGDKVTVNKLIDVHDLTKTDVLMEGFVTPSQMGRADFTELTFTLTDSLDPDISLRIAGHQSPEGDDYPVTYFQAGGNGQYMVGYEEGWDRIHIDNIWGTYTRHSFTGQFKEGQEVALDTIPMSLRYDASNVAVYVGEYMVADFDDTKFFSNLWNGFPSGYAWLSIEASSYNSATANFCLTEVLGVDLSASAIEIEAPAISIETDYSEMPEAKVGGTYPVPSATAYDYYNGSSSVKTSVYYNYSTPDAINIPIADGRFKTDYVGMYAIVYEAINANGISSREILWVHAGNQIPEITISCNQIGSTVDITLGEEFELTDITATGGSGLLNIQTFAIFNGSETEFEKKFRPDSAGDYTVRIVATDYIGNSQSADITVHTEAGDKPVFVDTPVLPWYFIGGGTYIVPELYANDYSTGKCVRKLATMELDGKTYQAGDTFVPKVENNGDMVTLTFKCENATMQKSIKTIQAFIREGEPLRDRLHMENYLVGEGVKYEKDNDSITVTATETDGKWTFANELIAENFDLELIGKADANYFAGLNIYLTDAVYDDVSVLVKLQNTGDKATVAINSMVFNLQQGFPTGGTFNITYANKAITVDATETSITECVNGNAFEGFPSGKIMLTIEFENALSDYAGYRVGKINGQPMSNATSDRIGPKISLLDRNYGGVSIGSVKKIPVAIAGDTLDPFITFTVTVTAPDGSIVKDVKGKELKNVNPAGEYEIKLDTYGRYTVLYVAADTFSGSESQLSLDLNVEDEVAPEIKLNGSVKSSATVGDYIVIPDFTVSDNLTATENITVMKYVLNPNGELITIPNDSNAIRCGKAGVYEIRIMAVDEAGNVTLGRFTVNVTEAE